MLVAVLACEEEQGLEGVYWLALLTGTPFEIPEDMVRNGQQYRAGWLVVPGQWYALRQRSERGYELLPQTEWIVVNHIIRLKNLKFTSSQSGPQARAPPASATPSAPRHISLSPPNLSPPVPCCLTGAQPSPERHRPGGGISGQLVRALLLLRGHAQHDPRRDRCQRGRGWRARSSAGWRAPSTTSHASAAHPRDHRPGGRLPRPAGDAELASIRQVYGGCPGWRCAGQQSTCDSLAVRSAVVSVSRFCFARALRA